MSKYYPCQTGNQNHWQEYLDIVKEMFHSEWKVAVDKSAQS